jgi:acyl-coenzyme A thioesterase PaaI-like protein
LEAAKCTRRIELPKPEGYRCFGCGTMNPCGLKMSFYSQGESVRSDIILNDHHVGWENIAHGGIISTVLDETMAWTVVAFRQVFFVTRSIEIRYLRPVQVNVPLTAIGEIDPEPVAKGCRVVGSLVDGEGSKMALAKAEMAFLPEKRLPLLPDKYRKDMERVFQEMRELLG